MDVIYDELQSKYKEKNIDMNHLSKLIKDNVKTLSHVSDVIINRTRTDVSSITEHIFAGDNVPTRKYENNMVDKRDDDKYNSVLTEEVMTALTNSTGKESKLTIFINN